MTNDKLDFILWGVFQVFLIWMMIMIMLGTAVMLYMTSKLITG